MITTSDIAKLPTNVKWIEVLAWHTNGDGNDNEVAVYTRLRGTGNLKQWKSSLNSNILDNKGVAEALQVLIWEIQSEKGYDIFIQFRLANGEPYEDDKVTEKFINKLMKARKTAPKHKPTKKSSIRTLENSVRNMF